MDILMSIGPLLISLGAFYVSILAYRRSGQREAIELHETTLALALSLEMTLKTSYANLLTLDLAGYRAEVVDVITKARQTMPGRVANSEEIRKSVEAVGESDQLGKIRTRLRSELASARTLVEMIAYGIERGRNP